jgi:hypothetical protein
MQNMDALANVIVLVVAGVGAVVALACVIQLLRHHGGRGSASSRLTLSGRG